MFMIKLYINLTLYFFVLKFELFYTYNLKLTYVMNPEISNVSISDMNDAESNLKLINYFYQYSNLLNSWESVFFNIEPKLTKIFMKMYRKFMRTKKYQYMEGLEYSAEKYLHVHNEAYGRKLVVLGGFPYYDINEYISSSFHKENMSDYYYGDYFLIKFILANCPPKSINVSYFSKKIDVKYFNQNVIRYNLHLDGLSVDDEISVN